MDKYFAESYDPRFDVAPLAASIPTVPATGLIDDAAYEGWDAMLELIRVRREDREEKKRLEKMGISSKSLKKKDKDRKGKGSGTLNGGMSGWAEDEVNVMGIEYKKKGEKREWDLGKDGF